MLAMSPQVLWECLALQLPKQCDNDKAGISGSTPLDTDQGEARASLGSQAPLDVLHLLQVALDTRPDVNIVTGHPWA
jgi:hypothetical protein